MAAIAGGGAWLFRVGEILLPAGGVYPRDAVQVLPAGWGGCEEDKLPVSPIGRSEIICLASPDIARLQMRKVDVDVGRPFFRARHSFDDGTQWMAWTTGDTWNGAGTPHFEIAAAKDVLRWLEKQGEIESWSLRGDRLCAVSADGSECWELEVIDTPEGVVSVWPVGAYAWSWNVDPEDEQRGLEVPSGTCRESNEGLATARKALAEGEIVAYTLLTLDEAREEEDVMAVVPSSAFAAAELAERSGFDVLMRVQLWDNGEIDTGWKVAVPVGLEESLQALVWDDGNGQMTYTLTRSTRHPGWQLTSWATDGGPWGHSDIEGSIADAFDTDPMASGQSLSGLVQVIFRDGTVLVRKDSSPIAFNPARFIEQDTRKRSLI